MYLIVGLGNPEKDYANTRHNMGFNVINEIAKNCDIKLSQFKFKGEYGKGIIEGEKVILLKPQTFMNLSGESIIQFKKFYKIENNQIIIIYDDIDTPVGKIRIRKKGGPGTHNGMKSVVHYLATDEFTRVRIGIGSPKENEDIIEYVIGKITEDEKKSLESSIEIGASAVIEIIKNGVDIAMNKFN
ncbi:MAG: aminoacyl-tRNA hydrolase [Clostridiales bacterium]|nr:aminoacyl-tRNA hydrolase [Clostridiales bacterium]